MRMMKRFLVLAVCPLLLVPQATAGTIAVKALGGSLVAPNSIKDPGDGSGRLFITQQTGEIRIWDGQQILPTPFLDLSSLVLLKIEAGLLDIEFHPDYATNGHFFVNYVGGTDAAPTTVVARYSVSPGDPDIADPASAFEILNLPRPSFNHNGGQLQFGPDGYLYISNGDGGGFGDPATNRAQKLDSAFGKLLRVDVDGGSPYAVPSDNPFVGVAGALGEIWAWGLRNPWRFSFDRLTGDLYVGDVGRDEWEEIDRQPADSPGGENYGWPFMEGNHCFVIPPVEGDNCNDGTLTEPILEYDHSQGCAVTAGYVYRGDEIPDLVGTFVYGDYCSGKIWGGTDNGAGTGTGTELLDTGLAVTAFGEDADGNLYFTSYVSGELYRIIPAFEISPPSGTYVSTQSFDLALVVRGSGVSVVGGTASLDGNDVTAQLLACVVPGTLFSGGQTFRCEELTGAFLGPGAHTFSATLDLSDGSSVSDTVTWNVEGSTEP